MEYQTIEVPGEITETLRQLGRVGSEYEGYRIVEDSFHRLNRWDATFRMVVATPEGQYAERFYRVPTTEEYDQSAYEFDEGNGVLFELVQAEKVLVTVYQRIRK